MRLKHILYILAFLLVSTTAHATDYFIDPNAGSGGNGTWSAPFDEWNDLPAMSTGDDVYFKCDTVYNVVPNQTIRITWEGTSSNPAVIGAWYGSGTKGVSGARPIISGNGYGAPASRWTSLVQVLNKDYIHVENIHITESKSWGLSFEGNIAASTNSAHFVVDNVKISNAGDSGIMVNRNRYNYGEIKNCEIVGWAYGLKHLSYGGWGAAIAVANCERSYTSIHDNYIHEGWGEGVLAFTDGYDDVTDTGYMTVYDNVFYSPRRVAMYTDGTTNTFYNNICIGSTDSTYQGLVSGDGRSWMQAGIGINAEKGYAPFYGDSTGGVFYNNVIIGFYMGAWLTHEAATEQTGLEWKDHILHSNTFIDNKFNYLFNNSLNRTSISGVVIRNNLSICTTGADCADYNTDYDFSTGATLSNNGWKVNPTNLSGSGDIQTGDSTVVGGVDWQDLQETDVANISAAFKLSGGSGVDAGYTLGSPYNTDIFGTSRPVGSGYDIGAHESGGGGQNTAPVALITTPSGPQSISAGGTVDFSGTVTDADGDNVSGSWNFDGGATNVSCSSAATPLTCSASATQFDTEGTYTVTFSGQDSAGASSNTPTVTITVGSPTTTGVLYDWNMEAADVVDDDSALNVDLINNGTITTGGSEPDPPGYGSVGAVLDGSTQYFSLSEVDYGSNALSNVDLDATIYIGFNADAAADGVDYLYTLYQASGVHFNIYTYTDANGVYVKFLWGYDGGASYQNFTVPHTFSTAEDIILGLSLDADNKTYIFTAQDVSTGTYYTTTEADKSLNGSFNAAFSPLYIGSGSSSSGFFDGTVYFVKVYDEAHTLAEMQTIVENTTSSSDIIRCYLGADKTYGESDTIDVYCDTNEFDLGGDGSATFDLAGTPNTECALQTANGTVTQIHFQGTVAAGTTHSGRITAASVNAITPNSSTFSGGFDDTVTTSGPGSIAYESEGYIDTSTPTISSLTLCDADGTNTTKNLTVMRGDYAYIKLCMSAGAYQVDGPVENLRLPFVLTTGGPLNFFYDPDQPSGFGVGNQCWMFRAMVTSDMEELDNIALSGVGDLDRDYVTGVDTDIKNILGVEVSSYNMPQVEADPAYKAKIRGAPFVYFDTGAGGSVTFSP
jgi:hypothetical protein